MDTPVLDYFKGHPERWTKGAYARNWLGQTVPSYNKAATCRCVVGAINFFYDHSQADDTEARIRIRRAVERLVPTDKNDLATSECVLTVWNDSTDFNTLIKVLEDAQI